MKAGFFVALLAAAALSGCTTGDTANPNLAAPKLVVAPRPDGNATLFIHSAFGERAYDWVTLRIDNETRLNRTASFSVEEVLAPGFYLEAEAGLGEVVYTLRGRFDVFVPEDHVSVSLVDHDGAWPREAESQRLPFEHLLERRAEA
ncbi:MAG TPA: hypothetical protein VM370_12140 [Candidatus Thermoplasmatota archaeon]|nr:hypothetical protein [Candidatus Thermoplasmatota archaeon]